LLIKLAAVKNYTFCTLMIRYNLRAFDSRVFYGLTQWFLTGGSPTPGGLKKHFRGVRNSVFEGESLYVIVRCTFFQNKQGL